MKKNQKGFSLVELIIVIAIMAVLIGLLAPQYLKFVKRSAVTADVSNANSLADCVNAAIMDSVSMPATISGVGGTSVANLSGVKNLPYSKVDKSFVWVITSDSTQGVTQITLNGKAIYPGDASNEYYEEYYK